MAVSGTCAIASCAKQRPKIVNMIFFIKSALLATKPLKIAGSALTTPPAKTNYTPSFKTTGNTIKY
jgi:hypothetical protein